MKNKINKLTRIKLNNIHVSLSAEGLHNTVGNTYNLVITSNTFYSKQINIELPVFAESTTLRTRPAAMSSRI